MPSLTVAVAVSGDDAGRSRSGTAYPPVTTLGGNATSSYMNARKNFATPTYDSNISTARFDTSSIPDDATVLSAVLEVYLESKGNADTRNLNVEWYSWTPPLSDSNYTDLAGTTAAAVTLASLTAAALNQIALTDAPTNISKTGYTGVRLGISGSTPTGLNEVWITSWDHATLAEPKLIVEYTEVPTFRFDISQFPKAKLQSPVPVCW